MGQAVGPIYIALHETQAVTRSAVDRPKKKACTLLPLFND